MTASCGSAFLSLLVLATAIAARVVDQERLSAEAIQKWSFTVWRSHGPVELDG